MTKEFSMKFVLLICVAAISGLAACTGTGSDQASTANGTAANSTNAATAKKSDYPPLVAKAAQAEMRHLDGSTSKVADRKGKVLLLNMWATWCGPCREEMPELVRMQDEHRDKGFEIIGLNTDDGDTPEMVEKFAKEMNLNYTLVWASTEMQEALLNFSKYPGIPQSFLVDRDGNLRGVFKGASPMEINKMKTAVAKVMAGEDTGAIEAPAANAAPQGNSNVVLKPVDENSADKKGK
jgi:thiol-disulfide isomerase/thioredoxin